MAGEERTEQPTARRRRQARERGQVATSADLTRAVGLGTIYLAWHASGRGMVAALTGAMERWLRQATDIELGPNTVMAGCREVLTLLAAVLAPVMIAAVVGTAIAAGTQTRGLLAPAALRLDADRINPLNGFKRLLSWRGLVAVLKSLLKVALVLLIAGWVLHTRMPRIMAMGAMELLPMMRAITELAAEMVLKCTITLVILGAADYAFEWWDHEKSLRMTRRELQRDLREEEGDPQIRRRRRELQRGMLAQGIMPEMPRADVVVTNPTHFAVALRYDPHEMIAPKVVARGQRAVAREIIRLARMHGILIIENPPVARSLFAACRLGEAVPQELYQVVAEIFAAVYRQRRRRARRLIDSESSRVS